MRLLAIALVLLLTGCPSWFRRVPEEPPLPPITRAMYLRLAPGMSAAAAEGVLGRPGQRVADHPAGGRRQITIRWTNADGTFLEATFEGDQLVGKAQRGLPD